MDVIDCQDESRILPLLEQDRSWTGYALCDLDEPYRRHSRFVGALHDGRARAVLLIYAPPGLTVLTPCGHPTGVGAIFEKAAVLPSSAILMARRVDLAAVESRYRVDRPVRMLRMVVTAEALMAPPPRVDARVIRLGANDLTALQGLYALWLEASFRPEMVTESIVYGVYHGGQLVAVAGAHAYSRRHRIGAIGGVFTHPAYRSRGLATAATGAVTGALAAQGVRDIILNVHADNKAAITAYRRLGFTEYMVFPEGHAVLRSDE